MQTWATLAAKHVVLSSGIGLGVIPAAGWDSLDGVAVGMLLACIGFAVVSARRVPNCQLPPVRGALAADGGEPTGGHRLARLRRRMDGLLTGILSDEADMRAPAAASRRLIGAVPVPERRFDAPPAWRGSYVDALPVRRSAESHPYPDVQAKAPSGGQPWPWLTASATVDGEQLWPLAGRDQASPLPSPAERRKDAVQRFMAAPVVDLDVARKVRAKAHGRLLPSAGEDAASRWSAGPAPMTGDTAARDETGPEVSNPAAHTADRSFWGPRGAAEEGAGSRSRSKQQPDAQAPDAQGKDKPQDGRRAKPRHAAPPMSLGATLTRRLTRTKLTSKSAAHAG